MRNENTVTVSEKEYLSIIGDAFLFNTSSANEILREIRSKENEGYHADCDGNFVIPKKWEDEFGHY